MSINKRSLIPAGLFCLVLFLSIIFHVMVNNDKNIHILFFPIEQQQQGDTPFAIAGERRKVPVGESMERNLELFVKELLLGPITISYNRLFPGDTSIRTIMYRNNILYLDFSAHMMYTEGLGITFKELVDGIKHNIRYNYPMLEQVVVSVEGFEPL